jgi:hypothetical protein
LPMTLTEGDTVSGVIVSPAFEPRKIDIEMLLVKDSLFVIPAKAGTQ